MELYIIDFILLIVFAVLYKKDRSRLINGFVFLMLCGCVYLTLLTIIQQTRNIPLQIFVFAVTVILILIVIFGALLITVIALYNGIVLIRREGFKLTNLLSLLMGLGIILLSYLDGIYLVRYSGERVLDLIFINGNALVLYFFVCFALFIVSSFIYLIYIPIKPQDYIIVLGAGLIDGERVTPILAGRIDRALKVYFKQVKKRKAPILIMSGGQGKNEKISEAAAMMDYALENGVAAEDIILENESKNTYENLLFSKQIIESKEGSLKKLRILFCTTNYHVFRASIYASQLHFNVHGIGSKTKFYFAYNAMLREFIALLVINKKFHVLGVSVFLMFINMLAFLFVS